MIITALLENESKNPKLLCEHGLSLLIERENETILFDTGKTDLFLKNATQMNKNLKTVDKVIISHGHSDHVGGLSAFLKENDTATIYLRENAVNDYFSKKGKMIYIGIDKSLISKQFFFTKEYYRFEDNSFLFSNVKGNSFSPNSNDNLYKKEKDQFVRDDFSHEQNLVIIENGKTVLISGCSHKGIVNILEHLKQQYNITPNIVVGGFHLSSPGKGTDENPEIVRSLAKRLLKENIIFYTCHCTGLNSYNILKEEMNDKIFYLSTGEKIII